MEKHIMSLKLQPLSDRVVVEAAAAEEVSTGGIILPDTAQEKPQKGSIVEVGKGTKENPITVKKGDIVLYGKYAGTELNYEGDDYLIMKETDILAIIG